MNAIESNFRPKVIRKIARWWKQRLVEADANGEFLDLPVNSEVIVKFQCSEEEALRGLCVGEQLYWGNS